MGNMQDATDILKVKRDRDNLIVDVVEKNKAVPYIKIIGNVNDPKTWIKVFKIAKEIFGMSIFKMLREECLKENLFW